MIDAIIAEMATLFRRGIFSEAVSFVFVVGESTITVGIDAESYAAVKGPATGKADCTCKTSAEMFRKIWYDGYRPGIMDFLSKEIRCDAPLLLPNFLRAFGK